MARIFITGSAEGLGLMGRGCLLRAVEVTLHASSKSRAADAGAALPGAQHIVIGDLSSIAGMRQVADQANSLKRFDAVIHNVGVGYREPKRIQTDDGLSHVFAINVLAPICSRRWSRDPIGSSILAQACIEAGTLI